MEPYAHIWPLDPLQYCQSLQYLMGSLRAHAKSDYSTGKAYSTLCAVFERTLKVTTVLASLQYLVGRLDSRT